MGTPATALRHRTDNKLYRLQSGQSPVVRPRLHNTYGMDSFPNGTNAIVAVISYTGYDMEDAMILNKSAHERGFAYGTVYKSYTVDLKELPGASRHSTTNTLHFGLGYEIRTVGENVHPYAAFIDDDGLPFPGVKLQPGDPYAAYIDDTTGRTKFVKYKGDEIAYVDSVRLLGTQFSIRYYHRILNRPQALTPETPNCRRSISHYGLRVHRSSVTSSLHATARRVSARRSGQPSTCLFLKAGCSQT